MGRSKQLWLLVLCVIFWVMRAGAVIEPVSYQPGGKYYPYGMKRTEIQCLGRSVTVYLPVSQYGSQPHAAVVFGHGQMLGEAHYEATLKHLAKKGIVAIFPQYETWWFDTNWRRMGADFAHMAECAVEEFPNDIQSERVVFAGHSKGAYVASIAASLNVGQKPKIVIALDPPRVDAETLKKMDPAISLTVVFGDADNIVLREISQQMYDLSPSRKKQFILLKSYGSEKASLAADHFWPQTKALTWFWGGRNGESEFHYFGLWKWLVAAAQDLEAGGYFINDYLFGRQAIEKGVAGQYDEVIRNFNVEDF